MMLIAWLNIIENSYDCGQVKTCPESDVLTKHGEIQACWNIIENSYDRTSLDLSTIRCIAKAWWNTIESSYDQVKSCLDWKGY